MRLSNMRQHAASARALETPEQAQVQLNRKRKHAASARALETPEQTQVRLCNMRQHAALARALETPEEAQVRLCNMRQHAASARALETPEQTQVRLNRKRKYAASARALETPEQTKVRLTNKRKHAASVRATPWDFMQNAAYNYEQKENYESHPLILIGGMNIGCSACGALKWKSETAGMCCSGGKVLLRAVQPPPEPLESLMRGDTKRSNEFLQNIRKYNSCFQMTSFGATREVQEAGFMPTFKVQGQIYHLAGSLLPLPNDEHRFLQIYFMGDERLEAWQRCRIFGGLDMETVLELQQMLHNTNIYVQTFKNALQRMPSNDYKVVIRADLRPTGEHERRFNAPISNDVAIVMVGNDFEKRDIVLERQNNQLQRISETHRSYDALQYPLIFCRGEDGYQFFIPQVNPRTGQELEGKKVSAMDFYGYRLMQRGGEINHILRCRQLFHQYVVDMYAKIESERLNFIRMNQKKLRVEEYIHLKDAIVNDGKVEEVGKLVILPSSFAGGPRQMHEYTQDAMTYVRNYGRPDLFITFTCNPSWREIEVELFKGQTPQDRHDLLARVFHQKHTKLMDVMIKGKIFGSVRCWMYTIEWQKRGLPHAHILVWLIQKIRPDQIDSVIRAELPNPTLDPKLFETIQKNMLHGPCGLLNKNSPCMRDGKCTRNYPRAFLQETQTGEDGYPLYRRLHPNDGGFTVKLKVRGGEEVVIDNRWVVPYCPLLSRLFDAHINVEYCNSVKSIKYICKYVNKGGDQAVFGLEKENPSVDEVTNYQLGRYISSNEAIWRILGFLIHDRHPTVIHLAVHLENGQRIYFTEKTALEKIKEPPRTTLTAFFELCQRDSFARTLLYCDVPRYYTWDISRKEFKRRIQGERVDGQEEIYSSDALGRVYTVHPNNLDCFYLRLLLHTVRGPTSFQNLKTVDGEVCATFREACQRLGLLEDDAHWDATMEEASVSKSPSQLRYLFAILITCCGVSNPLQLWEKHKESLAEDYLLQARQQNPDSTVCYSAAIYNQALISLEDKVMAMVGKNLQELGLPQANRIQAERASREILRETSYDIKQLTEFVNRTEPTLLPDQENAYRTILEAVREEVGGIFFLDAPGGTGKTYLINLLLAKVRQDKKIAVAVASSGVASTLLSGGRTAHTALRLPLNLAHTDLATCNIAKDTGRAMLLQECRFLVWDECTMSHKNALQALHKTLQDIRNNDKLMGGLVVLLAGDFRQTLPVIPRGTPADELNACVKASSLWMHVKKLSLTTNMRVHLRPDVTTETFAQQLLDLGNGLWEHDSKTGEVNFPNGFCNLVNNVEELRGGVFPNLSIQYRNREWLFERAILAPKNETVEKINYQLLQQIKGTIRTYKSVDTVTDPDQAVQYPTEFLNSLNPPGMPSHILVLKIGAPIMLLRNLEAPRLCNGTRLCIVNLMPHVIEAEIMTGCGKGEIVFIPRIPLIPNDMPFEFKRLQFPVRLCFAMSINKAQGQSLKVAGLQLENPCFSHGQLYVACSRVGSGKNLYIFAPGGKTKNVIYQKALM